MQNVIHQFIAFHRRRGLSEISEITSAKYFDLAFVTGGTDACNVNASDLCDICAMFVNPLTAKLFNLNFHPLEIVSR